LHLAQLESTVALVERTLEPHKLCTYLFELSVRLSEFYDQCPVLKSEGETRLARLALCLAVADTLEVCLSLLGIRAPHRM
jgi:arginyl-tRNA synthetase